MALGSFTNRNVAGEALPAPPKNAVNSKGIAAPYTNAEPGSGLFSGQQTPWQSIQNDMTHVNDRVSEQDLFNANSGMDHGTGTWGINNVPGALQDVAAGGQPPPAAPVDGPPQIPPTGGAGGVPGAGGVGTLEGLDFTKLGALEQYQKDTAGYFKEPTLTEMFATDAINKGAGPGVSNRAEEAYQKFNGSNPANMDPYYANERRKAEENINRVMAARGAYGSSAAGDLVNEAFTNLGADQAKAEAQYGLQRGGLLGSLASGADASSRAGSDDRRAWTSVLGQLASGADTSGLNRVVSGANVAGQAQGAQRTRGQDAINNQFAMGDRMSGIMGSGYNRVFETDLGLMKDIVGMNAGIGAEGYGQASNDAARARTNVQNDNNLFAGNFQFGKGLTDMFNQNTGQASPTPSPLPQQQTPYFYGPPSQSNYGTSNYYDPNNP